MAQKIQVRRDTALNWEDVNPILSVGEFGYEIDTKKVKIGDGLSAWIGLDYLSSGGSELTIDGYDIEENGEILRHTLDEFRSEKSNGDTFVITKDSASMVTMDTNGLLKKASEISSIGAGGQAVNYDGNDDIDNVKAWAITHAGIKLGEESPSDSKGLTATEQGIKGETKNHENVVTSFYDVDTNGLKTSGLQGNVEVTPLMIDIEDGQGKGVQIKHDRIILNDGVEPITLFKPPASGVTATHEWVTASVGQPPYIGTNGNWYVGGVDSGVKAEGTSIESVVKTSTSGNVDTYTITYSDSTTSTFNVTNGDNAVSWNFKGTLDTYADLLLVTGMLANDAYLVSEKDEDGTRYLYIYNGTSFPLEFEGLPYGVVDNDKLDALYNNLEITPEIDVFKDVPVFMDNYYYYTDAPDRDPDANYHILGPVLLKAGITYTIDTHLNAQNGALRLIWIMYNADTNAKVGLLVDYGQQFTTHRVFEFTPTFDVNVYVSDRKSEPRTKILSRLESERRFYLTENDIDQDTEFGVASYQKLAIKDKVLLKNNFKMSTGFSVVYGALPGVSTTDTINATYGLRFSEWEVDEDDYIVATGFFDGEFGIACFDEDKKYIKPLITGHGENELIENIRLEIPAGCRYIMWSGRDADKGSFLRVELHRKAGFTDMESVNDRLVYLEKSVGAPTTLRQINISEPTFLRIETDIRLPEFKGDKQNGTAKFYDGNILLFEANIDLDVQGNSTAGYEKKGFSIDLFNKENKSLKVAFGDWHPFDGFHLKSYQTDNTKVRDLACAKIWSEIRKDNTYPSNKIDTRPISFLNTDKDYLYNQKAKYFTDGIPCEIYNREVWQGVYILRLKKSVENYRMDKTNLKHIFLDGGYGANLADWNAESWELRSPKLAGYVEGAPIPNPNVLSDITRVFDWFKGCLNNTINMRNTYQDYINLDSYIDYLIHNNLIGHYDNSGNNTLLGSWDGNIWNLFPYDMDNTLGDFPFAQPFELRTNEASLSQNMNILTKILEVFEVEIKARYAYLRSTKTISIQKLEEIVNEYANRIPPNLLADDITKWGWYFQSVGYSSVEHILIYLDNKIKYLDSIWTI